VKFTVCDATGNPISNHAAVFAPTGGELTMTGRIRGTVENVNEAIVNDIPDAAFTYTGGQWHFNMATTSFDPGYTYTFRINLANGGAVTFQIALR
jgi:hypothetical protein